MISTKVILAFTLTGLGGGVTAAGVALSTWGPQPVTWQREVRPKPPEVVTIAAEPVQPAPTENAFVTLAPVMIVGRVQASHDAVAAPPAAQLVPCSRWRPLESGPAGHGVRELCYRTTDSLVAP